MAERTEERANEEQSGRNRLSAKELTEAATSTIVDLTDQEPETVAGMEWDGEAWRVQVDVVEVARIPNTTDVLATYEVRLDDEGTLLGYARTRRFTRGHVEVD